MLGSCALLALAPYCSFRTLARPELKFPNVSSYVAALVAVPSECVPPGSVPTIIVSTYQHHKLFPPSRLRRPSCARGSKGQRRRNAISPTAAAVFQDQSQCRPALPGTSINKTVSGCSADTRTHSPVRSDLPLSGASSKRRSNKTRMG